jgi:hypothetical protein
MAAAEIRESGDMPSEVRTMLPNGQVQPSLILDVEALFRSVYEFR